MADYPTKVSYIEFVSGDGLQLLVLAEYHTGKPRFSSVEELPSFIVRKIQRAKCLIEVEKTTQLWFDTIAERKYKLDYWCSMEIEGYPEWNKAVYKEEII